MQYVGNCLVFPPIKVVDFFQYFKLKAKRIKDLINILFLS